MGAVAIKEGNFVIKILPNLGVQGLSLQTFALLVLALVLAGTSKLRAQITKALQPAVVICNARLLTMDGKVIENGTIVCHGGLITAVGTSPKLPLLRRDIDASGKTITPGFIDASSAIGRTKSSASGNLLRRAEDAFDRYAVDGLREALRNGVTSAYVSVGPGTGIRGQGAIVRLQPQTGGSIGSILTPRAALEIDLGSTLSPLARINVLTGVHRQFQMARSYRESLENYEDRLEAYKKKLSERSAPKSRASGKKGKEKPRRTGEFATPEKPSAKPPTAPPKKDKTPKKPRKPRRSPSSERILDALDRELPVRITANKTADILNALDLAKEFNLDLVLEGASEAHLVATLIPAEVPIILSDLPREEFGPNGRATPLNGTLLRSTGSHRVVVGSGSRSPLATRFVAFLAQLDAAPGNSASGQTASPASRSDILERVTSIAADTLGVGGKIGRLRAGMQADFVIWSGDPLDPASRVEKVFVGGAKAYDADEETSE